MKKPTTPQELLAMVDRQEAKKNAPQNRAQTGRFVPGVSGNPGGRPKGFAEKIREATGDGVELVEFALAVMRNELRDIDGSPIEADVKARQEACKFLADRAFPKPTQEISLDESSTVALQGLKELSGEKLLELVRSERKAGNLDG